MRYSLFVLAFTIPIAGCAASTGILPAGPDTYTVTERLAPIRGGVTEAQRVALTEANAFCQQKDRVFVPMTMDEVGGLYGQHGYSVTFRCLLPDDPAVAKFRLERAPNLILEQRNQ
jgi:hypothetical protein